MIQVTKLFETIGRPIPECLKKPLEFGNDEQIAAIKRAREELQQMIDGTYEVEMYVAYHATVRVAADDEEEAKRVALDEFDPLDAFDSLPDVISVRKLPNPFEMKPVPPEMQPSLFEDLPKTA